MVKTSQGSGKVVGTQILTQLVNVQADDGKRFVVDVEDIEIILPSKSNEPGNKPARKQENNKTSNNNNKRDDSKQTDNNKKQNNDIESNNKQDNKNDNKQQ